MRRLRLLLVAGLAAIAAPALAAAPACSPPRDLEPAPVLAPRADEVVSGVVNAYYLLAISWTPEWCRTVGQGVTSQAMECGLPLGFTLHGLWPNGVAKPYPRYCRPVGAIDRGTVRGMYCRTPSAELLQHEWQAHGACGFSDPKAYFGKAAGLFDRVNLPRIESISPGSLTAGAVRRAFIAANPWLSEDKIYIQVTAGQRLSELRLCYDLAFRPMRCQGGTGTPDNVRIRLTPSRTGAF